LYVSESLKLAVQQSGYAAGQEGVEDVQDLRTVSSTLLAWLKDVWRLTPQLPLELEFKRRQDLLIALRMAAMGELAGCGANSEEDPLELLQAPSISHSHSQPPWNVLTLEYQYRSSCTESTVPMADIEYQEAKTCLLNLYVDTNTQNVSVQDLIKRYFGEIHPEFDGKSTPCQLEMHPCCAGTKVTQLVCIKEPEILVLQIMRWKWAFDANQAVRSRVILKMPEEGNCLKLPVKICAHQVIDAKSHCCICKVHRLHGTEDVDYEVYAAIVRIGEESVTGHYFALIKIRHEW